MKPPPQQQQQIPVSSNQTQSTSVPNHIVASAHSRLLTQ
jgi:hypothetical protein